MAKRYRKSEEPRETKQQKYQKSKEWNFPTYDQASEAKEKAAVNKDEVLKIRRRETGYSLVLYSKVKVSKPEGKADGQSTDSKS